MRTLLIGFPLLLVSVNVSAAWYDRPVAFGEDPLAVFDGSQPNEARIDHSLWQGLLDRYLLASQPSGVNRFDYGAVTAADDELLDAYLAKMRQVIPTDYPRAEQMAYWINLYNALTVRVILDHPGVASIRDIKSGPFKHGPWGLKLVRVAGESLSLNDVEHRILRPVFRDHRIHFAVNCASLGCPNLNPTAYDRDHLDAQLSRAEHAFINDRRAIRFDGGRLTLSSIFDWYRPDFANGRTGLLDYLAAHVDHDAARVAAFGGRIAYEYDWRLNAPGAAPGESPVLAHNPGSTAASRDRQMPALRAGDALPGQVNPDPAMK